MNSKRSDIFRPNNTVFIIFCLNNRPKKPGSPDSVATHRNKLGFAVFICKIQIKSPAVLCAEFKYIPNFHRFNFFQRFIAFFAFETAFNLNQISKIIYDKIPADVRIFIILGISICAGCKIFNIFDGVIRDKFQFYFRRQINRGNISLHKPSPL